MQVFPILLFLLVCELRLRCPHFSTHSISLESNSTICPHFYPIANLKQIACCIQGFNMENHLILDTSPFDKKLLIIVQTKLVILCSDYAPSYPF